MRSMVLSRGLMRNGVFCLLGVFVLTASDCPKQNQSPPPEVQPFFVSFGVAPSQLCLNQGLPFVRVFYEVDLGTWSNPSTLCLDIYANDSPVHNTVHLRCMDQGLSGEYTFNLTEYAGTNVDSVVSIRGELVPNVAGEVQDTATASVTTLVDCPPPSPIPNP